MGLGARLGGRRGALGLQHAGVGEDEAGDIGRGSGGGRRHHRRVEAVSLGAVHPGHAAAQADGLDDGALGLAQSLVFVLGLLLHHHLV